MPGTCQAIRFDFQSVYNRAVSFRLVITGEKEPGNAKQKQSKPERRAPVAAAKDDRREQKKFEDNLKKKHRDRRLQMWLAQADQVCQICAAFIFCI